MLFCTCSKYLSIKKKEKKNRLWPGNIKCMHKMKSRKKFLLKGLKPITINNKGHETNKVYAIVREENNMTLHFN